MGLFRFHFDHSLYILLIACFVWAINFRATFKNICDSMDLGNCWVLRFDPILILIKNIICVFFLLVYYYEFKLSKFNKNKIKIFVERRFERKKKFELIEIDKNFLLLGL